MAGKPPPTSTMSATTPALTMARLTTSMAVRNASGRMHWLPTWKETPSISSLAWRVLAQQRRRFLGGDAELARERIGGAVAGDGEAHDQRQVLGAAGFGQDLVQLVLAVEREGLDPEIVEGARDGAAALHRVHEGDLRVREAAVHQRRLGVRGDVEVLDAAGPERIQHPGRRDSPLRRKTPRPENACGTTAAAAATRCGRAIATGPSGASRAVRSRGERTWSIRLLPTMPPLASATLVKPRPALVGHA